MIAASALATITSTHGVRGVAVFDGGGTCIASDLPAPYEPILIAEALKRIAAATDVFSSLTNGPLNAFSANCEGGSVIVRRVESHTVLTLAAPGVNINLLNVALNVLALNLTRTLASQSARGVTSTSDLTGLFSSHRSQMLTASQSSPDEPIPPDAVGRPAVIRLLKVYTHFMGPAAKMVMKQQLAELGVTSRTLRESQREDLISRLAGRIPPGERQRAFLDAARASFR